MSLIDRYLPEYQFVERHEISNFASAGTVMAAVTPYDPLSDPLIRRLIDLREFAARIVGTLLHKETPPP